MGRWLCRGSRSVELPPRRLKEIPLMSFWPRCLFELVWRVRRGLSIGLSREAGPLLPGRGMFELPEWDWPRLLEFRERRRPVMLMLYRD